MHPGYFGLLTRRSVSFPQVFIPSVKGFLLRLAAGQTPAIALPNAALDVSTPVLRQAGQAPANGVRAGDGMADAQPGRDTAPAQLSSMQTDSGGNINDADGDSPPRPAPPVFAHSIAVTPPRARAAVGDYLLRSPAPQHRMAVGPSLGPNVLVSPLNPQRASQVRLMLYLHQPITLSSGLQS